MKKYIPILIITSLFLSACSTGSKEDLFQKKQECASYTQKMKDFTKEDLREEAVIIEIFYSPIRNSCFFVAEKSGLTFLYDFLSHKRESHYESYFCEGNNEDTRLCIQHREESYKEFQNLIKKLKGE